MVDHSEVTKMNGSNVLAELECEGVGKFEVKHQRFVVGRCQTAHMSISNSNLVSRKHIEFLRDIDNERFVLQCNGKNGIFVDGIFHKKTESISDAIPLKESCVVRFPSTKIQILFKSLLNDNDHRVSKQEAIDDSPPQYQRPVKDDSLGALESLSPQEEVIEEISTQVPKMERAIPTKKAYSPRTSDENTEFQKPPYSYAQLIIQAISSASDNQLTLAGIYLFITKHYPYYKNCDKGWQNSIRHNLSLNRYFIKVPRGQEEPGKGSFWRIDQSCEAKLIDQAWRKRHKGKFDAEPMSKRYKEESGSQVSSPTHASSGQYVFPKQQQQPQQQQQQILRTANGQQLLLVQDGGQRVVMEQPKRPQVQQIQIPASMAGQQLVVAQMPDGRQQIFALQGNQGTPVQLVHQGPQQIMQQQQSGVQGGTQLIMTSTGLKQIIQQATPQRIQPSIQPAPNMVARPSTSVSPTEDSLMPSEELSGVDQLNQGELTEGIEEDGEMMQVHGEETVITQDTPADGDVPAAVTDAN